MEQNITDRFEYHDSNLPPAAQTDLRARGFGCFGEYCGYEHWKRYREGDGMQSLYIIGKDVYELTYGWRGYIMKYIHPDEYENL